MEREAELLNVIQALQGQVEVLQNDHSKAKRMPKKAALAPVELSSSDEGGTVAMDDVDSDPGAFDNSVNLEDGNIHFGQNRRGSLESAKFTAEQMQQFINELDGKELDHLRHVGATDGHNCHKGGVVKLGCRAIGGSPSQSIPSRDHHPLPTDRHTLGRGREPCQLDRGATP